MLKAAILGNLGGDPELRYSPSGQAFLRMTVASNYRARTQGGEWEDRTEWLRVTLFGQQAERLSQYLRKGSKVYVDGRLEARPWTDQQGQPRAGLEVIANDVQFMSPRDGGDGRQSDAGREPAVAVRPLRGPAPAASSPPDEYDPELPF